MIQYTTKDNTVLATGTPFVLGDLQYPANWLDLATDAELLALGITKTLIIDTPVVVPEPTLSDVQAAKLVDLSTMAQTVITNNFVSSALGAQYVYPSQMTDQTNIMGNVLSSILPGIDTTKWSTLQICAPVVVPATGTLVWQYVEHTAAQIQQVGIDLKAHISDTLLKKAGFVAAVNAATTIDAVNAIVWALGS